MTNDATDQPGDNRIEFPDELEVLITRDFAAPREMVFDVHTKPEHVRETIAPFDEVVTECSIDLRVGGDYRYVFVTPDGVECAFHGTYLEVEPPYRTVQTWVFEGWADVEAVESMDLRERDGVTTLSYRLRFADRPGRDHMTSFDGHEANFDKVASYLASLLDTP